MTTAIATNQADNGKKDLTKARLWTGRVLTALPIVMLAMSAAMKLSHSADFVAKWEAMGFAEALLTPIGLLEALCLAVYAFPRTRILGAILVTAYLGGATVTHVRTGTPFLIPVVLGIFAWLGVYLTDTRLSALVPLRRP